MKKLIIPFLMLCVGYASMTRAENTDISNIDNVIYISPFSVSQGAQEVALSIKMKNTADIRGFQFDLYLPDGITVVKSDLGRIRGALTADRLPAEDKHDLTFSEQSDGAIRFLCSSQYEETFTGNDGEIATLKVNVAANMSLGDYPIFLKTIKLTETDISKFYETAQVETTVTVTEPQDTRVVLDENSTTAPEASSGAVDVRVIRTITAGNWSTICLPFAMTAAQVTTAFGDDVELADFTGYTTTKDAGDNIVGITVNFSSVSEIEANHPYIIKISSPAFTEFTVDGVTVAPEATPKVSFGYSTNKPYVYHPKDFIGTYVADFDFYNDATSYPLFLSGNNFYYATVSTQHMKAFRGYFDFADYLDEAEPSPVKMFVFVDDEETHIEGLESEQQTGDDVYDIMGRKVSKPNHNGVYIVGGKKKFFK